MDRAITWKCVLIVGFCCCISTAQAGLITADPDSFANGSVLNSAFPGLTLSAAGGFSGTDGNVYARANSSHSSTSPNVFGNTWTFGNTEWGEDNPPGSNQPELRIDFALPASSVSIDAIGDAFNSKGRLEAYDAANNLLDSFETGFIGEGVVGTMTVTAPWTIAYVLAGSPSGTVQPVHLDNLSANVVPEPSTLAALGGLLGMGLIGRWWRRRRR